MRKILILVAIIVVAGVAYRTRSPETPLEETKVTESPTPTQPVTTERKAVEVLVENLTIPWDIAFLSDGDFLVTERPGKITRIGKDGSKNDIDYNGVRHIGEGGLLGAVLHPKFSENKYIYLYLTTSGNGETVNRVDRYTLSENTLSNKTTIIDKIPGAIYHDGGRMEFGPDGLLYITTGDATRSKIAQDKNSLGGKVLRIRDDGSIPEDNPFNTAVYSYGHRNPQGLAWDNSGNLWETEHGRSGIVTGMDEINLIEAGANYGWPAIEGDETREDMKSPALHSGSKKTWAPASLAYLNGSLFFGGLRGEALYEAKLEGTKVVSLKEHFLKEFGRIRTVRVGPDNLLYITTSNRDDRGTPKPGDDKIIRVDPEQLN